MDSKITIQELKDRAKKFCDERDWEQFHNAKDLAIGIVTEAAELLDHFRFKSKEETEAIMKDAEKNTKIAEELADTLYFVLRISQKYGIDLSEAFNKKMLKNEEKYPVEKAKGSNKKYTEF